MSDRVDSQLSAARPAAHVRRIEEVLTQPGAPFGQHQRARGRIEQLERMHRRDDELDRTLNSRPHVPLREERTRAKDGRNAPAHVELVLPKPFAERARSTRDPRPLRP